MHNIVPLCLEQYVPYNVSVRAATSAGLGKAVYDTQFTQQGGKHSCKYSAMGRTFCCA